MDQQNNSRPRSPPPAYDAPPAYNSSPTDDPPPSYYTMFPFDYDVERQAEELERDDDSQNHPITGEDIFGICFLCTMAISLIALMILTVNGVFDLKDLDDVAAPIGL